MARGKKNPNGAGTIGKVGNRYVARISVPGSKGKKRKTVSGRTYTEAHQKMVKLQAQMNGKPLVEVKTLNVADFLSRWLQRVKPTIAPSTYRSYTSIVRTHLIPTLGDIRLDSLRPEAIERLKKPGYEPSTINRILLYLSMALNRAVEWGFISKNPCKSVKKPKPKKKMRALAEEEVARLLSVVSEEDEPFYRVAVTLGLRKGELLALKWEDVDLSSRTLEVKASVDTHHRGERWGATKTGERRTIIFGEKVKRCLASIPRTALLVFPGTNGKARRHGTLAVQFKKYLEAAELPKRVRIQDLRHTAATLALRANTPIQEVSRMLGHSSPDITLKVYSHVLSGMGEESAKRQDAYQF